MRSRCGIQIICYHRTQHTLLSDLNSARTTPKFCTYTYLYSIYGLIQFEDFRLHNTFVRCDLRTQNSVADVSILDFPARQMYQQSRYVKE